jgi:NAD(P)-dependent dehydrogenase (short-subunit alcohol dehydrogenase family)
LATVVVTGGARGIGRALVDAYVAAGAYLVAGVRKPGASDPPGCEVLPLDVADDSSVAAFAAALAGRPVDILINNAGVLGPEGRAIDVADYAGFLDTLNVNTLGPLRVTRALLPNLRRAGGAKVAILSSRMGAMTDARSDWITYRASKAAVNKVAQGLATDLAAEGIAVAAIHPGAVRTAMAADDADMEPRESAAALRLLLERLTLDTTGRFWRYDGQAMAW